MPDSKPKVIIIVGPTASGKSEIAVEIAKKYHGEVVSADSRQVYKNLDIGTSKITQEEMRGIPHHLIDIVDVDTIYTAENFKRDARRVIAQIVEREHIPVIAGGTFFYIDTLLDRISTPQVPPNAKLRAELESHDAPTLYEVLHKLDPRRAENIDPHNKRRLVRALEIIETLGVVPENVAKEPPYTTLMIGIDTPKEELLQRLENRAQSWLTRGLIAEVEHLLKSGVSRERLSEIGFEYQLCLDVIDGTLETKNFPEKFVQKNWQYAKRQMTYLKRDKSIHWIRRSEKQELDLLVTQFLVQ